MKATKTHVGFVVALMVVLGTMMTGCAKQPSKIPMQYTDSQIAPGHGRLVFALVRDVGDEKTVGAGTVAVTVAAVLFVPAAAQMVTHDLGDDYNLFEVVGKTFVPMTEFTVPATTLVYPDKIFYVDLPAGQHHFYIARVKRELFEHHFTDGRIAFDIDVREGETTPMFFGPGPFDSKNMRHPISIQPYSLKNEDISFCYGLRNMNISDEDRMKQIEERVRGYFSDPQAGIKLHVALAAVALMQPARPSDDFKKWVEKQQEYMPTDYAEADISQADKGPYDVYKNADLKK